MIGTKRIVGIILLGIVLSGCEEGLDASTSAVEFSPNPAPTVAGICTSDATVVTVSGQSVTLVSLTVVFSDATGSSAEYVLGTEDLVDRFGSIVIPGSSAASAELAFDLTGQGLAPPAAGTVVLIGVRDGGTTQFVGTLECEG